MNIMSFSKIILSIAFACISIACTAVKEPPKTFDDLITSYGGSPQTPYHKGAYKALVWAEHNGGFFEHSESESFKAFCNAAGPGALFKFSLTKMSCINQKGDPIFSVVSTVISGNFSFIKGTIYEFYEGTQNISNQQAEEWIAQQKQRTRALDELSYSSREAWMARELSKY